jgi:fatty-acyl-CoA synthase
MEVKTHPEYSTRYPLLLTNCMRRPIDYYPDDVAVVYRNDAGEYYRFTWRQWYRRTSQLAHALDELGIKPGKQGEPGDRVATMALNHHRHLELCYAPVCIGAISHPINIELSPDNIAYTINHAEDKVIFVDETIMPSLERIYDRIKSTVKAFIYMSDHPGKPQTKIEPLFEYEELIKGQPEEYDWPYLNEQTPAALYYTTDETEAPKGVMFTHRQLYLQTIHPVAGVQLNPIPWDLPEDLPAIRVPLVNLPLYHIHAWGTPWYHVLAASRIVFPGRFTPQNFCELVETERVTSTVLVPTMLNAISEYKDAKKHDLSSILAIGVVGAVLPLELKAKVEKIFPNAKISSGYGMTETAGLSLQSFAKRHMFDWPRKKIDEALAKTGLPPLGIEAQVIGKDGKPVPNDNKSLGEIVLRGSWIMEQYFKAPEKTASVWKDGWFHTGDIAKVDEDGYFIISTA